MHPSFRILPSLLLVFLFSAPALAQEVKTRPETAPSLAANSDATYQALRKAGLSGEAVAANNLVLKRDAGVFTLRSGAVAFLAPVKGKVTGAVFIGEGTFSLTPPLAGEQKSLALLTREPRMEETFSELVLRFTDGSYEEIKKLAGGATASVPAGAEGALNDINGALRIKLHYNLHARLLEDVLNSEPGGAFFAFIKGRKYNGKLLYVIDPRGVPAVYRDFDLRLAPEEVALLTWDDQKLGIWASFHFSAQYAPGKDLGLEQNSAYNIEHQQLDTRVDSGRISGMAATVIVSQANGLKVVPLTLYRTLRVQTVTDASGQPLAFIQEDKDEDANFAVILAKSLANGERVTIKTTYSGKDVMLSEGGGNYYLYSAVRHSWYPNSYLGDYATYEMTFHVAKGTKLVATGSLVREITEGGESITTWRSDVAQTVAGFNLGKFKRVEAKVGKDDFLIESYTNESEPDWIRLVAQFGAKEIEANPYAGRGYQITERGALGNLSTRPLMQKALAEGQLAVQIYTDYFGPLPYKRLAMTQQTDLQHIYGQAWPGLVYLPITYFFDSTARQALKLHDPKGYFKVVGPHEVAHQWWGHTICWASYRDQWMSEGFSELSASLFLQALDKDPKEFIKFWDDELQLLTERNTEGYRAIDVGPVTQGYRLATRTAGYDIPRRLIYPKGGYILHMVRMMMWTPQKGDESFKVMMRDFTRTFANRQATTEDFKRMVEKHMPPDMDVRGNGKMDWFFDQYVYGTALPTYKLDYAFADAPDGQVLNVKITQSGVDDRFVMIVPLYLEVAKGKVTRLGTTAITGNSTAEAKIPLRGMKEKPKRAMLNYFNDVLAITEQSK